MLQKTNPVRSYLLAGTLLHIITGIELLVILFFVPLLIEIDPNGNYFIFTLKYYGIFFIISLPFFSQLDAFSRFQNYKQVKDQIFLYGFDERIFKPVLKSRCQRDAALLSAQELGHGDRCMNYFRSRGYRWYHIIPDFVYRKPHFLFTLYFWKTTFFCPRYVPKVDYNSLIVYEPHARILNDATFPAN